MTNHILSIKLLDRTDISAVLNYWMDASPDQLKRMGADPEKMPTRKDFEQMLLKQLDTPMKEKSGLATIWMINGSRVGHCNINQLEFGKVANLHLHLWSPDNRANGYGQELLRKSICLFFESLQLEMLYCEPYALNAAPNRILPKAGFTFVKKYQCIPGSINFEQEVNRWVLKKQVSL